jgi:hypothetical protein
METCIPVRASIPEVFRTLDQSWWADFLARTSHFSKTGVFQDVLTPDQVALMNQYTMHALQRMCTRASSQNGFRLYLDGKEQSEADKQQRVFAHPPQPCEPVSDWASRVFGKEKFGLIINQIEKFSAPLAEAISALIEPLLTLAGIPLNGFHTSTFIGNYGYTPLGIHQDHQGASVIHFHLGPGPKTMYTWDEELYAQLAQNKPNNKDIGPLLPLATAYTFGAGDIYFMPWNQYHIGYSDALSVGVTFWFDNHTSEAILNKLFDLLKGKYLNIRQKHITSPQRPGDNFGQFRQVMSAFDATLISPATSLREVLATIHQESLLTLFSNGGWRFKPLPLRHEGQPTNTFQLLDSQLQLVYPFRIYYRSATDDDLLIYCRGTELQVPNHPALVQVIDRLNAGNQVATRTLLDMLAEWPAETGLYLLQLLVESRAVHRSSN